jgi:hypothetical protein
MWNWKMKFLLDTQQDKLRRRMETSSLIMGQLLTPLTKYACWGGTFAVDNGAFSHFHADRFQRLLGRNECRKEQCLFVACPDVVGSAQKTLELFKRRGEWIPDGWRIAFVMQDGIEDLVIPWDELDAAFIGGKDPWKDSQAAADVVREAKRRGKWTHAGRVNSPDRFEHFQNLGVDTCDGSGVAKYDHMLIRIEERVLR